jgi:hypothetical protein
MTTTNQSGIYCEIKSHKIHVAMSSENVTFTEIDERLKHIKTLVLHGMVMILQGL